MIMMVDDRWARALSNLLEFVSVQGLCSGPGAHAGGGSSALARGPPAASENCPRRTRTQSRGARYKSFISVTIVPHQNYSSTKHKNTKNRFPAPNPMSTYPQRSQPDGSLGLRGGVSQGAAAHLPGLVLSSGGAGTGGVPFASIPAGLEPSCPLAPAYSQDTLKK